MKKLLKVALVLGCMIFAGNIARAQVKIGYVNMNELIDKMPETATIKKQMEDYQKQFLDQLTAMNNEFQAKAKIYNDGRAKMTDAERTSKEAELNDLQKRLSDFQNNAQQQIDAKTNELSKPLFDKVRGAVAQVAKEKGYAYVLNSAQTELLYSSPNDDLMADVKAKLGLK